MQSNRKDCYILIMLINVTILITLFVFSYSTNYEDVEKTKCNIQNLYNAFTITDIQNIQKKDTLLRRLFTNTKFLPKLMLDNYLQVPKSKRAFINRRYQLLLQNCSHQMNTCIKYIIKLHADDCILDPSNHYIYYKHRKRIYRSTVQHDRQSEFLFKINTQKTHFIYLNNKLNLLFCEQIGYEMIYNVFHYRLKTQSCILRTKLSMPHTTRLKRSIFKPKNGGTMLIIIIALAIGVPILIIITSVIIITSIYCCCQENRTVEDELPKSLIENCRQAEPPLEEQGKYLPELFDASAFQFKGPLIIEYPKLHILEHDLTNIKPDGSNVNDHVQFDENLNVERKVEVLK
ncbi:Leucine-rich repeat-containing protein [Dirofilaria immitis]